MERDDNHPVELGAASTETKGSYLPTGDLVFGSPNPALVDD